MIILKHLSPQKLLVAQSQSLMLYDTSTDTTLDVELPKLITTQKENQNISVIAISRYRKYFAILRTKQVTIYDNNLKVVTEFVLKRAAHTIALFDGYNTLVADKTGDVYLYKINKDNQVESTLLLGHLSMLLDVVLSNDEKFLVTCDRDEKIRVSHYPNTYNILRFCLGHDEFVTKIILLDNLTLLSASGDGKVIVWDFLKGGILHTIKTSDYVNDKSVVNNFIKRMEQDKCEVICLPIIDMQIKKVDEIYYIAVQIYDLKSLHIYALDLTKDHISSKLIQNVCFSSEIKTFSLSEEMFVSTGEDISMFIFCENKFIKVEKDCLRKLKLCEEDQNDYDISTLYKRKFDNVQEYLERKRQRME